MREQETLTKMHISSDVVGIVREHSKRKVRVQMPAYMAPQFLMHVSMSSDYCVVITM